jgi:hypothetical protein
MSQNAQIISAIQGKRTLSFIYEGHPRVVEPYTYGVDRKGHLALRAYQTGGTSQSGRIPDWRLFHESDMRQIAVLGTSFAPRLSEYRRGDKAFSTIHREI